MIDFTRAFESAWERMLIILFRPFDLGKWCVIGFSAFLAGLIAGGNGVNGSGNYRQNLDNDFKTGHLQFNTNSSGNAKALQQFNDQIHQFFTSWSFGIIVVTVVAIFLFVVGLSLLLFWLGARGQFMFLDNIVRNRGAVGWPWHTYARQANSFFLFYLLLEFLTFLIILPILGVAILVCYPLFQQSRWPVGLEIGELAGLGAVYLILAIALGIVLFLYREFGVAIMFRQRLMGREAFMEVLRLTARQPGNVSLFLLLRIGLFLATAVICLIICCLTCCCLYQIPYVGTVLILPVLIFLRCFSLDCLAQMAPHYDAFTVDVPPQPPATT